MRRRTQRALPRPASARELELARLPQPVGEALLVVRVAGDADQLTAGADAVGDQARVPAGTERAVDDDLAGLGVERLDQLARQHRNVNALHVYK